VNVTGTTAGAKNNSVQVTSTEGGTGNTSNATVTVVAPPVIIKAFEQPAFPERLHQLDLHDSEQQHWDHANRRRLQ